MRRLREQLLKSSFPVRIVEKSRGRVREVKYRYFFIFEKREWGEGFSTVSWIELKRKNSSINKNILGTLRFVKYFPFDRTLKKRR